MHDADSAVALIPRMLAARDLPVLKLIGAAPARTRAFVTWWRRAGPA